MSSTTIVHVSRQAATPTVGPANQLDVVLMPWGAEADVTDDGRTAYRERWEPGSLIPDGDSVPVYGSHVQTPRGLERGPLVGVARDFTDTANGLAATIHLATDEGRRIHELAGLGVRAAVSIEADAADPVADDTGVVVRTADRPAVLTGVATILPPQRPAYADALVTAVRAAPGQLSLEDRIAALEANATPTEPDEEDPDEEDPDKEEEEVTDTATETAGRAGIAEMVRTEVARYGLAGTARPAAHPLQRFDTLQSAIKAGYEDVEIARALGAMMVGRALADQVTTDPNTGVIHQGWVNQIYGIVDQGRPAINAIGTAALPPDGMTINWPTFAGDLTTLVGVQATQKTPITSVKVSIGNANAPLKTFAGGSDISLQLINRSSPAYLEAYLRIMAAAYAAVTDKDAATALSAQVTLARNNFVIYDPAAADPTGSGLRTAVFTASTKVQAATGSPGSVILAGLTAFVKLGGSLTPAPIFNSTGTANASTLKIDVDGLNVVYDPYLAPTEILVTNSQAAQWREEGPQTINSTDVEKLGQNYAVWGMALLTPTIPTGIVGLRTVAPTTADEQAAYDDGYLTDPPEKASKK